MKKILLISAIISVFFTTQIEAQEFRNYNLYSQNSSLYNPITTYFKAIGL